MTNMYLYAGLGCSIGSNPQSKPAIREAGCFSQQRVDRLLFGCQSL